MGKNSNRDEHVITINPKHWAQFAHNIFSDFKNADNIIICSLVSIILIGIYLYFEPKFGEVYLPLKNTKVLSDATTSGKLNVYYYYINNGITINEIFKSLLILFVISIILLSIGKALYRKISEWLEGFPTIRDLINNYFPKLNKLNIKEWIADPTKYVIEKEDSKKIYPILKYEIPYKVTRLKYIKFDVSIMESTGHWRAGIYIRNDNPEYDYVFHAYMDKNDSRFKVKMTKREFKIGHIGEKTQILENIIDKNNFSMKIQRIKNNNYGLFINNQKIESYEVPADDIKLIKIGAWADDYYYKIKFNNIEYEG